ncbi:hypothetical protein ACIRQY_01675 [Streptomyces sp. NPDC101490]|uniref:hypothetical protein n=1 Tax=Streptomyces sp. NPDC101490 TaxID=3366143 RepID=UPI00382C581F
MSSVYGPPVCAQCDRPIRGDIRRLEVFSSSGARPDVLVHATRLACLDPSLDQPPARPDAR